MEEKEIVELNSRCESYKNDDEDYGVVAEMQIKDGEKTLFLTSAFTCKSEFLEVHETIESILDIYTGKNNKPGELDRILEASAEIQSDPEEDTYYEQCNTLCDMVIEEMKKQGWDKYLADVCDC